MRIRTQALASASLSTALLLTGFGLKDSINAIVGKQFDEIFLYDGQLMINTENNGAEQELDRLLAANPVMESPQLPVMNEVMPCRTNGSKYGRGSFFAAYQSLCE